MTEPNQETIPQETIPQETIPQETSAGSSRSIWTTLSFAREALVCLALSIFLLQPLIQLFMRFVERTKVSRLQYPDLTRYESAIDATHKIMIITTVALFLCFIAFAVYCRLNKEQIPASHRISLLNRETAHRLVPYFLMVLFSAGILVSTIIRGTTTWDMIGHWYMHESIYSYIIYALAYFFCAMLLWSDKARRILLFLLVGTALPIHLLVLVDQWGTPISYFVAKGLGTVGVIAVFFNGNHYGYYLMLTLLPAALLFVYERHILLRVFCAACGITATIALVINNTLGAYLAVLFVLILFVIYCVIMDRQHLKGALLILGVFMFITFVMSFRYNTILSSFLVLSNDIGMIIADPLEADSGGSGRWWLWKETVKHIPEHPLVGFGVEGLLSEYGVGTPHNEFLQYTAFFGIPVMLYYTAACCVVLWRIFRNHKQMSNSTMVCFFVTIGYLASSFFGVTIFYTTPYLYILLGMTYAEYLRNGKRTAHDKADAPSAVTENAPAEELTQAALIGTGQNDSHSAGQESLSIEDARQQGLTEGLSIGRKEGAELHLITMVCKKLRNQKTAGQIAEDLEEELSMIEAICQAAEDEAPAYDVEAIFRKLHP